MIKAILFDMDGVLVDSEEVSIRVGEEYFKSKGVNITHDDFLPHLGGGERKFFEGPSKAKGYSLNYEDASQFFKEHYEEYLSKTHAALPGIDIVKRARKAGIITAVCSSAPRWKVFVNIAAIGLEESDFDMVFSGESVKRNKPFGDIYLNAAINLGLDPKECIVVEDSLFGVKAGKNANMRVLAVTGTESATSLAAAGADVIVTDLSAITEFTNPTEFEAIFEDYSKSNSDGILYGTSFITPFKRRASDEEIIERMIKEASMASDNAYAPYSKFKVGAALLSAATNRIYRGCNVENSSYGATICAERNAVIHAIAEEGSLGIDILVVYSDDDPPAPPCAVCLQVLAEFSRPDTKVVLVSVDGFRKTYLFKELLPNPFIFPTLRN